MMEASVEDIEFANNTFTVAGTDKSKTLTEYLALCLCPANYPIDELEPGLEETAFYDPKKLHLSGRLPYRRGRDRSGNRRRPRGELHRGDDVGAWSTR